MKMTCEDHKEEAVFSVARRRARYGRRTRQGDLEAIYYVK